MRVYGMFINTSKCVFGENNVTFLGYNISAKGTKPLEQKVDSIENFPIPKTVKELHRFSGMINFCRRFITDAAHIQTSFNALLTGSIKNSHPINIIGEALKAFNTLTDRGKQFESTLFQHPARVAGFHCKRTTAYHPACNSLIERFHRQLKTAITCHANENWIESLPLVLLGVRSAYKDYLKTSCVQLVYGETLRLPGEFINPSTTKMTDITDYISPPDSTHLYENSNHPQYHVIANALPLFKKT
ncbi:Retrovirus-related Pol polyprotein from transposon 412 [Eumeta japonica]|uniref:Retrovirus-related Pol polyprotein from transposon 412 n=1 Tax=Eumeta variegata TaxID=151549 RepID=A0A4C1TKU7_EUMVA|nr:Retrovirus-related Pol polyprotein from transposon 412 [Eumeta japonica]